jgi:hypothetical protein
MADAIGGNPWQNFFNNFTNENPAADAQDPNAEAELPGGDALDGADEDLDQATKDYLAYLEAEKSVVVKSVMAFAPIFKSFIDQAMEMEQ